MSVHARRQFLRFLAASPLCSLSYSAAGQSQPASPAPAVIASPDLVLNVFEFEAIARNHIPPAHFGYLATGVDDDRTLRANHEAFNHLQLRPRRLVDVSHVDTSVELFGTTWSAPLFL